MEKILVTKSYLPDISRYQSYVEKIWHNCHLTNQGPLLTQLEGELKQYLDVENFQFVSNGTIALQLGLIEKCLNSILSQQTTFPFDIVVADDCSSDGTTEIINQYVQKYPDKIVHLRQEKNIGPGDNFQTALDYIQSPYIAYCDGDDYWTSPVKLQLAVDILDANPDCSIFVHNTHLHDHRSGAISPMVGSGWAASLKNNRFRLPNNHYTHISARVFRNMKFPQNGDTFMYHYLLSKGAGYYHDEVMSVYNYDGSGVWSRLSPEEQRYQNRKVVYELNNCLGYEYDGYYTGLMPKQLLLYKMIWGKEGGWSKFIHHSGRKRKAG